MYQLKKYQKLMKKCKMIFLTVLNTDFISLALNLSTFRETLKKRTIIELKFS